MAFENIEASYIGDQLKLNMGRIVSNMRDNAEGYKSTVSKDQADAPKIAEIMGQDANAFLLRIKLVTDFAARSNIKYQTVLSAIGWTSIEVTDLQNLLFSVCNHIIAAALKSADDIITESDFILTTLPTFERTF